MFGLYIMIPDVTRTYYLASSPGELSSVKPSTSSQVTPSRHKNIHEIDGSLSPCSTPTLPAIGGL